MYFSFALAWHRGTCLRPLHIFALLCFACARIPLYVYTSTSTVQTGRWAAYRAAISTSVYRAESVR